MAIRDIFKVGFKTFVNPRAWLSYDVLKEQTKTVVGYFNVVFKPAPPEIGPTETFEEAVKRLKLNREDLKVSERNYFIVAVAFAILGVIGLVFSFYFLVTLFFLRFLISLSLTIYLFAQSFSYHFYYYQIKNRKLGSTFEEWRKETLKR